MVMVVLRYFVLIPITGVALPSAAQFRSARPSTASLRIQASRLERPYVRFYVPSIHKRVTDRSKFASRLTEERPWSPRFPSAIWRSV